MGQDKPLRFKNSQEWRRWLEENSDTAPEVWLEHHKKHSHKDTLSLSDAVTEALCFGWVDGKLKSIDGDRFILRYSPRRADSVWSRINKERAEKLIAQGRMTPGGLAIIEEAKKRGLWDAAYTDRTRDELPADLASALRDNLQAQNNFEKFANTYRNMYIRWVLSARTEATRQKRIAEVVKRSAANKKPGI